MPKPQRKHNLGFFTFDSSESQGYHFREIEPAKLLTQLPPQLNNGKRRQYPNLAPGVGPRNAGALPGCPVRLAGRPTDKSIAGAWFIEMLVEISGVLRPACLTDKVMPGRAGLSWELLSPGDDEVSFEVKGLLIDSDFMASDSPLNPPIKAGKDTPATKAWVWARTSYLDAHGVVQTCRLYAPCANLVIDINRIEQMFEKKKFLTTPVADVLDGPSRVKQWLEAAPPASWVVWKDLMAAVLDEATRLSNIRATK